MTVPSAIQVFFSSQFFVLSSHSAIGGPDIALQRMWRDSLCGLQEGKESSIVMLSTSKLRLFYVSNSAFRMIERMKEHSLSLNE